MHAGLTRAVAVVAVLAAGGYIAIAALLYFCQRQILFQPGDDPPSVHLAGPRAREVKIPSAIGPILAWYVPPSRTDGPVVTYFHGNAGTIANRAQRFRRFEDAGWGVVMPEYPGYDGTPGAPSEQAFETVGRATLDWLASFGVPPRRTVIYGESIGTAVATISAAGHPCAALLLEAPFTSITDIAIRRFPWLPVRWLLKDPFDQAARIGAIQCPILIMQGDADEVVPPDLGRALYSLAPHPKEFWVALGGATTTWQATAHWNTPSTSQTQRWQRRTNSPTLRSDKRSKSYGGVPR